MSDDRPDVYEDDNGLVFRASSFGACSKRLVLAGQGIAPAPWPEDLLKAFAEGNANEDAILRSGSGQKHQVRWFNYTERDEFVPFSWTVRDPQHPSSYRGVGDEVLRTPHDGPFTVSMGVPGGTIFGHMDGIAHVHSTTSAAWDNGTAFVLEVKAFGDAYWKKFCAEGIDGFPQYQMQVSVYGHAANLPVLFVVGHKDENGEVFEYRAEWLAVEHLIPKGVIVMRAAQISWALEHGDIPTCENEVYPCPYFFMHETPPRQEIEDEMLERWIDELEDLKADVKDKGTRIDELKAMIRARWIEKVGEKQTGIVGEYTVTHVVSEQPERDVHYKARTDSYVKITRRKANDE